jgi:hypothetical protein
MDCFRYADELTWSKMFAKCIGNEEIISRPSTVKICFKPDIEKHKKHIIVALMNRKTIKIALIASK